LIAKPFDVSRDYAQLIYDQTSSPRLDKVLRQWDQENWAGSAQRQKLAYVILVELLAYQFASPVRWIETQDKLFIDFTFERFIEIGPAPILTGMATRTLKAKYEPRDDSINHARSILSHAKNAKEIYYQFEDEVEVPPIVESASAVTVTAAASPVPVVVTATPSPAIAAASIEDVPIKAIDVLLVIIAQKLKEKIDEVPLSSRSRSSSVANPLFKTKSLAICNWNSPLRLRRARSFLSRNSGQRWVPDSLVTSGNIRTA
jgi:fatty acid synthase subunit beta